MQPGTKILEEQKAAPEIDTGLACLVMMARLHNIAASPEQIKHEYSRAQCTMDGGAHLDAFSGFYSWRAVTL